MSLWPEPLTIPKQVREFKERMLAVLRDDEEMQDQKELDLKYIVASSSGKAVSEDIPKQIGKRAGWASTQGANFIEIIIENPAQLIMDQDMLVNLAGQLNLHYNIHSSTNLAYGMSYRQMQGAGYDPAHEYTAKLLTELARFRDALEDQGLPKENDPLPILYSINPHMAVSQIPAEEDRLANDISVDPFGDEIRYSRIWENRETRLGVWKYYLWEYQNIGDDVSEFAQILGNIEEVDDAQDYIRENLIALLVEEGYISNSLLQFINDLQRAESVQIGPQQQIGSQQVANFLDIRTFQFQDLPRRIDELQNHVNGNTLAQQAATLDPQAAYNRLSEERREIVDIFLDENGLSLPNTEGLDLSKDVWRDLNEEAQKSILDRDGRAFQEVTDFFGSPDDEFEGRRKPSEVMKNIASNRAYQDDFNKESTVFRRIMPLWMPFAEEAPVRQMWEGITSQPFSDHEEAIDWLYGAEGDGAAMNRPRAEEDVIAAATGAYVWGHFTQIPPGYEKTFVERLEEIDMYMTFESHFVGGAENTRIWKPKDMIEVVKAINSTRVPVVGDELDITSNTATFDRTRITIDMEHIATQKVDPLWVIDPPKHIQEQEGYKGLEDGDGKYILMEHVTHPYLGEGGPGHFHGPIQRGDTLVYRYMWNLIDKGMAKTDDWAVFMYEIGAEKTETMFLMRLMLRMIEYGIHPDELTTGGKNDVTKILNKDRPENLKEYMIQKFFGVSDTEVQHEWQEIFEHALDPLDDLLQAPQGSHTWMGRAATEGGTRPEDWQKEKWK